MELKSKILPKIVVSMVLFSMLLVNFSFVQAQTTSGPQVKPLFPTIEKIKQATGIDTGQIYLQNTGSSIQQQKASEGGQSACRFWSWSGFDLKICAAEALAVLGNAGVWISGIFLDLTEYLFDYALGKNLDIETFNPNNPNQTMVIRGWTMLRDLANMLFIFILLIIAIAVIVGVETYGIKKALPTLIIIVLLINFSLLIPRYIIEFSNTLAGYLYCQAIGKKDPCFDSKDRVEISTLLRNGLKPWNVIEANREIEQKQGIIGVKNKRLAKLNEMLAEPVKYGLYGNLLEERKKERESLLAEINNTPQILTDLEEDKNNIFLTILAATVFGSAILLIAAFVFLSAAILLVIRIVMLWILMIFAPIALLLWALPSTAGHGRTWLSYLLNQALFFPVFVFFLFLSIQLVTGIQSGETAAFIDEVAIKLTAGLTSKALTNGNFLFDYAIIIVMMLASLSFARSMASHGASSLIAFGDKARGVALGYAKAGGLVAGGYAWGVGPGRAYQAVKGRIMRPPKTLGEEDKGGILHRALGAVAPGFRGGIRAGMKEDIEGLKKIQDSRASSDIAATFGRMLTTPKDRVAMLSILAGRRDLDELAKAGVKSELVEATINLAKSSGIKTSDIERLKYQWKPWEKMTKEGEREETIKKLRSQEIIKAIDENDDKLFKGLQMFVNEKNPEEATFEELLIKLNKINPTLGHYLEGSFIAAPVKSYFKSGKGTQAGGKGSPKQHPGQMNIPGIPPINP